MKTLLLIASLLAATPDAGTPPKKPDAGQVEKKVETTAERRFKLLMIVNDFKAALAKADSKVEVLNILFAAKSTDEKDAVVVLATVDGKLIANFFIYTDGKWTVFPTDFAAVGAP